MCISFDGETKLTQVFVFRRSVRLGEKDYKVVRMEVHPDADWTLLKNYIAILFLEEDVEFSGELTFYYIRLFSKTL